jgi:hypothetical protein
MPLWPDERARCDGGSSSRTGLFAGSGSFLVSMGAMVWSRSEPDDGSDWAVRLLRAPRRLGRAGRRSESGPGRRHDAHSGRNGTATNPTDSITLSALIEGNGRPRRGARRRATGGRAAKRRSGAAGGVSGGIRWLREPRPAPPTPETSLICRGRIERPYHYDGRPGPPTPPPDRRSGPWWTEQTHRSTGRPQGIRSRSTGWRRISTETGSEPRYGGCVGQDTTICSGFGA